MPGERSCHPKLAWQSNDEFRSLHPHGCLHTWTFSALSSYLQSSLVSSVNSVPRLGLDGEAAPFASVLKPLSRHVSKAGKTALSQCGALRRSPCIFSQGRNWPRGQLTINWAREWLLNPATLTSEIMGPGRLAKTYQARLAEHVILPWPAHSLAPPPLSPALSNCPAYPISLPLVKLPYLPSLRRPIHGVASAPVADDRRRPERLIVVQRPPWRPQLPRC